MREIPIRTKFLYTCLPGIKIIYDTDHFQLILKIYTAVPQGSQNTASYTVYLPGRMMSHTPGFFDKKL